MGRDRRARALLITTLVLGFAPASDAGAQPLDAADLAQLSLEELLEVRVISPSRKDERAFDSAAAIYVLTAEDIRRSGATSIPELLRRVPGVHVARIDASRWAISLRGFNSLFANKLLVMIDGRSVYTPDFGGVWWDLQDTALADIDRIEVIRGPGAAVWGSNAVNGVINILTKRAEDTTGSWVGVGAGSEDRVIATVRQGALIGSDGAIRVYGKYRNLDASRRLDDDTDSLDDWEEVRGGFRMDWTPSPRTRLTVQGDAHTGDQGIELTVVTGGSPAEELVEDRTEVRGGNLLARLSHDLGSDSNVEVKVYWDEDRRDSVLLDQRRSTFDLEFHHRFQPLSFLDLVWGLGHRHIQDDLTAGTGLAFVPTEQTYTLSSGFLEGEIDLLEGLTAAAGVRVEHYDLAERDWQAQPRLRLRWTPTSDHTLWAGYSRSIRNPSRVLVDGRVSLAGSDTPLGPIVVEGQGDPGWRADEAHTFELGYRTRPIDHVTLDLSLFYARYRYLARTFQPVGEAVPLDPGPGTLIPLRFGDDGESDTYGGELVVDLRPIDRWRVELSYTYLFVDAKDQQEANEALLVGAFRSDPRHQFGLRSELSLPADLELDAHLRWIDEIPGIEVDAYAELDLRLAWAGIDGFEFSLVGQNLLADAHTEYTTNVFQLETSQIQRGIYGQIVWTMP